jgi:hypothetical protein
MATKTRKQLTQERIDRAVAEAHELHPGDDITVEVSFYGAELFVDVWKKGENRTVARYVDVVDDLEAELTRPDRVRSR